METNLSNSQNQTCRRCGSSDVLTHEREFSNGTHHIELRCINSHYIKFLPQNKPLLVMPFGLYRGQAIKDLPDDYLNWILENLNLKGGVFRALSEEYERRGRTAA
jgi:Putative quorum-sensing-regulated virulence factor